MPKTTKETKILTLEHLIEGIEDYYGAEGVQNAIGAWLASQGFTVVESSDDIEDIEYEVLSSGTGHVLHVIWSEPQEDSSDEDEADQQNDEARDEPKENENRRKGE